MDIYLFSGTHWDREWYCDFQRFRMRLVETINELIDVLETDPAYGVFHLDGQTIVLEDYLEIMPENRPRLEQLIQSGKLVVGPWYCMPDEFLLSGESLIKNLQKGFRIARQFGAEPMKFGYICDIFGHIAQMPQIFSQLGIHHALLGRGTNEHTTPAHFCWQGADGSRVTAFKLADKFGYGTYSNAVRSGGSLADNLRALVDYEAKRSDVPIVLLMDATDHIPCNKDSAQQLELIRGMYPGAKVHHCSVMEMCRQLDRMDAMLPVKAGELREPAKAEAGYLHLITHTLSSRYPLKKWNDRLQSRLEKVAQPLYAFGLVSLPERYLELANQYLLQNHPHDSICGCSIDQVHRDMKYRFAQAESISRLILQSYQFDLVKPSDTKNKVLRIYNPLPYDLERTIEAEIPFEADYPTTYQEPFGYQPLKSFRLYDQADTELSYGICDIKTGQSYWTKERYEGRQADLYRITFRARLRAAGVTEFAILPSRTPSRHLSRLPQSETGAENEFLRLEIRPDGRIDLWDKQTGKAFSGLLGAVDDGELGDGWYHVNPAIDRVITNTAARIEKLQSNALQTVFRVTQQLGLPAGICDGKRSEHLIPYQIIHTLTLSKGERQLRVKTEIDNNVCDHRLRIKLPTGIGGREYYASQPFCFVRRETGIDLSTQDWKECEVPEKQMSGIVLKKDDAGGFAFISEYGLHECAAMENGDLYITLLRACKNTVGTNGEPDGQLQEKLEYSYLLAPFGKETSFADLQRKQDILQTELLTLCDYGEPEGGQESQLQMRQDNILFSTANKSADGMELRVYNMSEAASDTVLTLPARIKKASLINLDGETLQELSLQGNQLPLSLNGYQFATLLLRA